MHKLKKEVVISQATMDGQWWAWLKKDENDGVEYVEVTPVSPARNPCPHIGVEPFLFLHGYAPGPADFTYIPKVMGAGERFTSRPERCRAEAPHLTRLYHNYKDRGSIVVAINSFNDTQDQAKKYVAELVWPSQFS